MIKRMFFIVFSCLLPLILFSQNNTIKGLTTDENGEPLIGVNIVVKGKTIGTVSDVQGNYIINAEPGEILVFSYIGYESIEVPITQNVINVILKEDVTYLDEVVAIGYGSQKRSNVTNAISTIKGEDLISRGTGSADEALIGKVAGVRVMQMDGMPGRGMDIKVRGISSINFSNNPLYVIDGFPVDNLRSVTTGDIESIEVLKDAASTAIYGSRGSQGVILITTKRGAKGKPVVQLNTDLIVQRPWSKINVLNRDEWIEFAIEERNNTYELNGGNRNNDNSKRAAAYQIDPLWLTDPASLPDHDWYDITTRNALMQKYQLSVSGATDDVKYYISSNWLDQPGVVLYTDFNRLSFTSNVEGSVKDFLSIGVNLNASQEEQNDPQTSSFAAGVSRIQLTPPVIGLEQNTENGGYYPYAGSFIINPLAQLRDETRFYKTRKIRANVYADVKFTSEFKLRSSFGAYLNNRTTQQYIMANLTRGKGSSGFAESTENTNYLTEHVLSYEKLFKDIEFGAIGGFSYQENSYYSIYAARSGFADDQVKTLNAGTDMTGASSSMNKWTMMSFFTRLNVAYKNRYLGYISLRRDGSSRFGKDSKWGYFPAVSLGWRISEEEFMKDLTWLSNLKLKGSYGVAGNNNIGNYAPYSTLASNNYVWGNDVVPGYSIGGYENSHLGWEKTHTLDVGLEMGFLKNRIQFNVDYFNARTKDLLLNLNIPQVTGFSSAMKNLGEVENQGFEFELTTTNIYRKNFSWTTNANISNYLNKVLKLGDDNAPIYGYADGYMVTITEVGQPIGSYYMFGTDGVFMNQEDFDSNPHYKTQKVGDTKYIDYNKDGVIDNDDKFIQGNAYPDFTYGMTNTFTYKDFDLSFSVDGQVGGKILRSFGRQDGQSRGNVWKFWLDRWKSEEDPGNGKVPRAVVSANMTTPSSFWLFDQTYFALRNISLGYTVPQSFLKNQNIISSLNFKLSVDNVYMYDHYNHAPTTANQSNSAIVPNNDSATTYPISQNYTIGVSCTF